MSASGVILGSSPGRQHQVRVYGRLLANSFLEAYSHRTAFWMGAGAMMTNNVAWIIIWAFFFDEVGDVRGWDGDRIRLLMAIVATVTGLVLGFFSNVRRLAEMANTGELDAALALPVATLPYVACRQVKPGGVGDFLFGPLLFMLVANPTPSRIAIYVVGALSGAAVLMGFLIVVGSVGLRYRSDVVSEQSFQAILLFAFYPVDIFGPWARFFMYIVVPAGFVSAVPVRLLDRADGGLLAVQLAVAVGLLTAGVVSFNWAMRHYTSGAAWTQG